MKLYGCPGCGSAAIEAMLQMAGLAYEYVKATPWEPDEKLDELKRINPLAQVPTLLLDDGAVMTESAAIMLWLAEQTPGMIPQQSAQRALFFRWMVFVPANLYSVYLYRDFPERWVEGAAQQNAFREKVTERIKAVWGVLEDALQPAPYVLGSSMTALDIYLAMVSRWSPGRQWFNENCPRLRAAVALTEQHPVIARIWESNFGK